MQPSVALYLFSAAVIHIQHGHVHVQLYYITMSLCHIVTFVVNFDWSAGYMHLVHYGI